MCGIEKSIDNFTPDNRRRDGHISICKECACIVSKANYQKFKEKIKKRCHDYYLAHKEHYREYRRQYSKEHYQRYSKKYYLLHRRDILNYQQEYYQCHKEEILKRRQRGRQSEYLKEYLKEYRKTHRKEILKYIKKYQQTHKQKVIEWQRKYHSSPKGHLKINRANHKRRARIKNTEATLTVEQWENILMIQSNHCNVCGKRFTKKRPPTIDHIIPVSRGGGLTYENIQALCKSCNSRKHAKIDPGFIQSWCCVET